MTKIYTYSLELGQMAENNDVIINLYGEKWRLAGCPQYR
jgi:hypothetical protein